MTKHLELQADYSSTGLSSLDPEFAGLVYPESLPLSAETLARLQAWIDRYDAQLNIADPVNSRFLEGDELAEFEKEGVRLWLLLREETFSGI